MDNSTHEMTRTLPPDRLSVPRIDFTELATRVCNVQGLPTTDNIQIDEMSEMLSATLDVLAHEYSMSAVVFELEHRKATRPPRPVNPSSQVS